MWRRPLNSVFNHYYPQKIKKVAGEDRDLSAGLDDKQVDGGNEWRGLYNGRKHPQVGDRKILRREIEQDLL